jgi:hypothetical protein
VVSAGELEASASARRLDYVPRGREVHFVTNWINTGSSAPERGQKRTVLTRSCAKIEPVAALGFTTRMA